VAKKSGPVESEQLDDATKELALLAQELDLGADRANDDEKDDEDEDKGDEDNNNDNDGSDGEDGMSEEELAELQASLVPIRLMLTKVS
jgi:hypothetical protein